LGRLASLYNGQLAMQNERIMFIIKELSYEHSKLLLLLRPIAKLSSNASWCFSVIYMEMWEYPLVLKVLLAVVFLSEIA
jgi:hypothetical protein